MIEINRTPKLIEWYFKEAIWSSPDNQLWITFDDGPDPLWTVKFSDLLTRYGLKAIFFIVGERVNDIEIVRYVKNSGHEIGWHGNEHSSFIRMNREQLLNQFSSKKKIEDILGVEFKYFRFPYGRFLPYMLKIVDAMEMLPIFWSYMIYDYKEQPVGKLKSSLKGLRESDILLLHDHSKNAENTYKALKSFLETCQLRIRKL